jgi:ketosteroid isomerase-like protein
VAGENLDLVKSTFDVFARGDLDEIRALLADDLIVHRPEPDGAVYHGPDGFFQATAEWTEDFEDWTYTPVEFLDAGESVAVKVHQTATGAQSGVPVESDIWFVYTVRDGKVARLSFHLREEEAREAAGLR